MSRRFFSESRMDGIFSQEEVEACKAVGSVNAFRRGLVEVLVELQESAPQGWRVAASAATHSFDPATPLWENAETEPILLGFVRVHQDDPHFPIWLYKEFSNDRPTGINCAITRVDNVRYTILPPSNRGTMPARWEVPALKLHRADLYREIANKLRLLLLEIMADDETVLSEHLVIRAEELLRESQWD